MLAARICFAALLLLPTLGNTAAEPGEAFPGIKQFAADLAKQDGFDPAALDTLLASARPQPDIIAAMQRPHEDKPWRDYRRIFLTEARIQGGVRFWRENRELLGLAEHVFGVPPEIIAAILGVETSYGKHCGRWRTLDALATLGFDYPPRADFFRGQLRQFLLLGREEGIDPDSTQGSYAGALGMPQFIPSSYRAYAVDFDGDGRRDLWQSKADVIGSVANYFRVHGWSPGEAVAYPARLAKDLPPDLPVAGHRPLEPSQRASRLAELGVRWDKPIDGSTPATLALLDGEEDEYWILFNNFYAITRYNISNLYAMAVYQLSEEIRRRYSERN